MLHDWRRPVTPRSIALWFLSTADPEPLRAGTLIERAAIFGIDPAAVRVALGRLTRDELARQVDRGVYAIGPGAAAVHAKARSWARVEQTIRPWQGRWVVVQTDHLGRTDRSRLQARERALRLTGFAVASSGLWVRPDNLRRDSLALAVGLEALGLDAGALLLAGCAAQPADDAAFRALWPVAELEAAYRYWLDEMRTSTKRVTAAAIPDAARESYLLGQSVLRAINSDPLLPAELIDVGLRGEMVEAMKRYNTLALRFWRTLP